MISIAVVVGGKVNPGDYVASYIDSPEQLPEEFHCGIPGTRYLACGRLSGCIVPKTRTARQLRSYEALLFQLGQAYN